MKTESDVEQKFIYKLLTAARPDGLELSSRFIQTKANIRSFSIGKGTEQKLYYPDYLIVLGGMPIAVIEAKEVGVELTQAFREARLYAGELNGLYNSGIAPAYYVIATNGEELWAGPWDQSTPTLKCRTEELAPYSQALGALYEAVGLPALERQLQKVRAKIAPLQVWKPRALLGGQAVQDEVMGRNTFGATISSNLAKTFSPTSRADRAKVVKEAYVTSSRRTRYVLPIDNIIRAAAPISHSDAQLIEDTTRPAKLLDKLKDRRDLEHKVLLLVGGAGAGKSTFVDYLQEVALPADLRDQTVWVHLNMNVAPISKNEIYDWLRVNLIRELAASLPNYDFEELENLRLLYSVEVNRFNKGRGKLLSGDKYNDALAELLAGLEKDLHATALAYCRFCGGERGKLIILVLDNCDKRLLDEQLLMFEAANWLKQEFKAMVMLPLREETYDNHRDEPPLDTVLKDLVFRIEAPAFHSVLSKRVTLAINELHSGQRTHRYDLSNGMHVDYGAADQAKYLSSIVASLFGEDKTLSRLVLGLSGGNLRRAFEIFLEICNSGHIPESEILKIKSSSGEYQIPLYIILRVLLRQNRRFYDGTKSYIRNIFSTSSTPDPKQYFLQMVILNWLKGRQGELGPTKLIGFFPIRLLIDEVSVVGFEAERVFQEIEALASAHCITTEDFRVDNLTEATLVKLAPAGMVHLDLLSDVNYWAAVAEDIYFSNKSTATVIADRMSDAKYHYALGTAWMNASDTLDFVESVQKLATGNSAFLERNSFNALTDLSSARAGVEASAATLGLGGWVTAAKKYLPGQELTVSIARMLPFGFFVDIEPTVSGMLHKTKLPRGVWESVSMKEGTRVRIRVVSVETAARKVHIEWIGFV
jgi:hypothetical protein